MIYIKMMQYRMEGCEFKRHERILALWEKRCQNE